MGNATINCPTLGGVLLSIFGQNFGQDGLAITIGENDCNNPTFVTETLVTCVLPQGAGSELDVRVNRAQRFSQVSVDTVYLLHL